MSLPRSLAARVLNRMEASSKLLDEILREEGRNVPPPPRRKAKALSSAVLRRKWTIDQIIKVFADQKPSGIERHLLTCLRLGVAELFFLPSENPTPPEAVVDAVVKLAGGKYRRKRGFVNGVLRAVLRGSTLQRPRRGRAVPGLGGGRGGDVPRA